MAFGYIPEEIINEIRHQTDLVAVISEYVTLTKSGNNYKALCPFHREKTPSFVVNPQKQIFHCYGCGLGGNVFTFLMQYEKYTFPEAVHVLAKRLGIQLPTKTTNQSAQQLGRLEVLYKLHLEVAQYFVRQLTQSEQGKKAYEYLQNRGIGENIMRTFSLGYASPAWDDLQKVFIRKYSADLLVESGLMIKKTNGIGRYDRFRDRLMIPIHDDRGRVVAFGGRTLGEGEPKYLNSPESPIFHKGHVLFGLHHTKDAIRRNGRILIVEGYFDMIVPYSFGVENIAATMGTALTEHHLRLIQRYTNKVTLVFDPDPAGIRAVHRTLDLFLESGFEVNAVILPKEEDPDTAVRRMGVEQFQRYIAHAPLLLDFIRERIIEQYDISRSDQRVKCANEILPTIAKIQNIPERNDQISKTADLLKVTEADHALQEEFKKIARTGKTRVVQPIPEKRADIPPVEKYLIKALVKDKSLIPRVQEELDPTELSHPVAQKVVQELFVYTDKTDFESKILDLFNGTEYQNSLAGLFMSADEVVDSTKTVQDCLYHLKKKDFDRTTMDVTRKVRLAQEKNNKEGLNAFLEQKNKDLQRKKKNFL
jgi:DNA primase